MENFLENYELNGELLEISEYPAKVLKQIAPEVTEFNEELQTLVKNMLYTMYMTPGIGLAAPQVGISTRLFVMDTGFEREGFTGISGVEEYRYSNLNPKVFINPTFVKKEGKFNYEEGCLSLPGIYEEVERFKDVEVEYFDMFGEKHTVEASDLEAVCLQHENDHLDGIVFIEKLSLLKKNFYKKKFTKKKK